MGPHCWTWETWWSRQAWPEVPGARGLPPSPSGSLCLPDRVNHPRVGKGGIINNNANKREKTKPAGPEHFLNKEISLISWLI